MFRLKRNSAVNKDPLLVRVDLFNRNEGYFEMSWNFECDLFCDLLL